MSEFNQAPREYQPTPPHEYVLQGSENNFFAKEMIDVPETPAAADAEDNAAPASRETRAPDERETRAPDRRETRAPRDAETPPPTEAPASAPKSPKPGTPLMNKLAGLAAAVVGVTLIGSAYVENARAEEARFTEVTQEQDAIFMEVEVTKWSENLQIRISGDGLDEDYYIPVELPDEETESDTEQSRTLFYEYRFEQSDEPRTLTVALVGSKMFMNDVLDSRTVTIAPRPPDESPPAVGAGVIGGVSYLFDPATANADLYAEIVIEEWSDALRLMLTTENETLVFNLERPAEERMTVAFEHRFEQDDNTGLPMSVTVTLLGLDDVILDEREVELTEEANEPAAVIVSATATADGIDVIVDAPVIEGEIMIVAEQNGDTVAEYSLTEEDERMEDGSGYFEIFLVGDMTDAGEDITVFLYDTEGNLLDSTVITMA